MEYHQACRTGFLFFLFFPSFQHSLEGQLALPWCMRGMVHTQLAFWQNLLGKDTEEQQHSTESSDEHCDKIKGVLICLKSGFGINNKLQLSCFVQLSCWFASPALDALSCFFSSSSPHHPAVLFSIPSSPTCLLYALFLPLLELPCVRSSQYLDSTCSPSCQAWSGAKANVWLKCWSGSGLVSAGEMG